MGERPRWVEELRVDPRPVLSATRDPALLAVVDQDLLDRQVAFGPVWSLPDVARRLGRQQPSGAWRYSGARGFDDAVDYDQLATYTELVVLVERYRLDRRHEQIARAAEFLMAAQTEAGDIRGMYARQYSTTYTALIGWVLAQAGYGSDDRVRALQQWLVDMRQDDGGWALPLRTAFPGEGFRAVFAHDTAEPVRARPASHLVTGVALRALVVNRRWRRGPVVHRAAELLAGRVFAPDRYPDRRSAAYWTKLCFPFHWTDLVSTLDVLAVAGLGADHPKVREVTAWLRDHQRADGLWPSAYTSSRHPNADEWVSFGAARALRRLLGD